MSQEDEDAHKNPLVVMVDEGTMERYSRSAGRKGVGTAGSLDWLIKDISRELVSWGHAGGVEGNFTLKADGLWKMSEMLWLNFMVEE